MNKLKILGEKLNKILCYDYTKTLSVLSSIMLILSLFTLSSVYYDFLILIIFVSSAFILFRYYQSKEKSVFVIFFLLVLLLFNPFIPVIIDRQIWQILNVFSALIFWIYFLKDFSEKIKIIAILSLILFLILFIPLPPQEINHLKILGNNGFVVKIKEDSMFAEEKPIMHETIIHNNLITFFIQKCINLIPVKSDEEIKFNFKE